MKDHVYSQLEDLEVEMRLNFLKEDMNLEKFLEKVNIINQLE